jgi:HK97 family phage prohead protease
MGIIGYLHGYAALWNVRAKVKSRRLGKFKEELLPYAFTKDALRGPVIFCVDHDRLTPVALGGLGLTFAQDDIGLRVRVALPDDAGGRRVIQAVELGLAKGMSFAMDELANDAEFETDAIGGKTRCVVRRIPGLADVTLCVRMNPVYPETKQHLRLERVTPARSYSLPAAPTPAPSVGAAAVLRGAGRAALQRRLERLVWAMAPYTHSDFARQRADLAGLPAVERRARQVELDAAEERVAESRETLGRMALEYNAACLAAGAADLVL